MVFRGHPRYFEVRYEDLVGRAEPTVRLVDRTCGLLVRTCAVAERGWALSMSSKSNVPEEASHPNQRLSSLRIRLYRSLALGLQVLMPPSGLGPHDVFRVSGNYSRSIACLVKL